MANRLNYNDLLKYMEIVLDMEKNVYVELKSWQDLQGQMNSLGISRNYNAPNKSVVVFPTENIFVGVFIGLFVMPILQYASCVLEEGKSSFQFFNGFPIITGLVICLLIIIFVLRGYFKDKNRIDEQYNNELNTYNQTLADDQARVQKELVQKQYLQTQCDTLATMWRTSKEKLDKMYSYNILEEKYRNIVAVASIYEYLKHERTRSLQRVGSDEGAYNIFESEVRLNKIITNTDIIIQKLDVVIENQRELANTMRNAQNSINNLVTSTNNMSARIQSGMNRLNASVELSNYQQQQTNNELRYMNFMNTLHFYS